MKFFIKGFNTLGFAFPIVSDLFILIDHIIYWIANLSLQTFFKIEALSADVAVNAPQIKFIMNRIMILAGVFALFRLCIMLINYLINPDKTSELSKTSTSIVTSVVIAIVLLSSMNFIFEQLGKFQHLIFTNQVIPQLIYGPKNGDEGKRYSSADEAGRFVNNVWLLFFTPKNENGCVDDNSSSCLAYNRVKSGEYGTILALEGGQYSDFDYLPIVSGIVGIVLIYYFLRFSVDLGIRVIELFVLQVIAPIPIIMSIDPSRKKQLQTFATTYLGVYGQIFLRVLTFYIAFVAVDIFQNVLSNTVDGTLSGALLLRTDINLFIQVILIIAVFHSVNKLPKLIEDALGVKLGIDTSTKGFGGVLKGILGGTTGLIGGGIAGGLTGGVGGALAGAASGMWNAGMGAAAGKNAAAGISATIGAIGRSNQLGYQVRKANGLGGYMLGKMDNLTGMPNRIDRTASDAKSRYDAYGAFEQAVYDDYAKADNPLTGGKYGKMENDARVQAADLEIQKYRQSVINGTTTYSASYMSGLVARKKKEEERWKTDALKWFEQGDARTAGSIDRATGKIKYDPKQYTTLSASQRAHYDLIRTDKDALKALTGSAATVNLYDVFDTSKKNAKKDLDLAESAQHTSRYKNAKAASGK